MLAWEKMKKNKWYLGIFRIHKFQRLLTNEHKLDWKCCILFQDRMWMSTSAFVEEDHLLWMASKRDKHCSRSGPDSSQNGGLDSYKSEQKWTTMNKRANLFNLFIFNCFYLNSPKFRLSFTSETLFKLLPPLSLTG